MVIGGNTDGLATDLGPEADDQRGAGEEDGVVGAEQAGRPLLVHQLLQQHNTQRRIERGTSGTQNAECMYTVHTDTDI